MNVVFSSLRKEGGKRGSVAGRRERNKPSITSALRILNLV
jgi:hypothetical protein